MSQRSGNSWNASWVVGAFAMAASSACSGGMHDARAMTAVEAETLVSRPPPPEVPRVEGLSTIGARVRIGAPPAKVWQVFAVGFGDVDDWAGAGIADSECTSGAGGELGAVRSCRIAEHMPFFGGDDYEERIIGWDEKEGYFSVLQTRATGPTQILVNESWVDGDGQGGSVVTGLVHVDFTFPVSLMAGSLRSSLKRKQVEGLIGLKHLCETGEKVTQDNWEAVVERYPHVLTDNDV